MIRNTSKARNEAMFNEMDGMEAESERLSWLLQSSTTIPPTQTYARAAKLWIPHLSLCGGVVPSIKG